ncbi:hypothetical protein BDF19DRAFT_420744 [Syncephalis fuscata]|nr:hypothetical protein BDF19DRAFT_420744 [Syncephalis fuscata]
MTSTRSSEDSLVDASTDLVVDHLYTPTTQEVHYPLLPLNPTPTTSVDNKEVRLNLPHHYLISNEKLTKQHRGPPSPNCCLFTKILMAATIVIWVVFVVWQVILIQQQQQPETQSPP